MSRKGLFAALTLVAMIGLPGTPCFSAVGSDDLAKFAYTVNGFKADMRFRAPTSLAVDQNSNLVYVCDLEDRVISAFSLQGSAKFRIGGKGELEDPVAIAVDRNGNLYVSERRARKIKIFDSRNNPFGEIDLAEVEESGKVQPGRLTVTRDGEIVVVDQANQQILVFDKQRKLKLKFGKIGDRPGEFRTIEDVAADRQGRIYVVDSSGIPVQVFDKTGAYISRIGSRSEVDGLLQPVALATDRFDQLWVVDSVEHNIRIYDRIGFLLRTFGEYGMTERSLFYPIDVDVDSLGRVYVLERGSRRMQVFELASPYQPIPRSR
ncbi:MAG: NHL repeat-containing protein [Armatimonadota bacterium]|nr:NHL repeat-containing protein [Armatimonadota bacterium]